MVDEHVGRGPIGVLAPGWYLAPQRRDVAEAGWRLGAMLTGALGDGPVMGMANPPAAVMVVQLAGEFASAEVKARIWAAADDYFEPTWDRDAGEFTFGFGLGEDHPRGQWNARAMAGWVATEGAWSSVFNEPDLAKFAAPTAEGVDFPRVALSVARWDGEALHLAAHPQNASVRDTRTTVRVVNVDHSAGWVVTRPDGETVALDQDDAALAVELIVDNHPVRVHRTDR